jgi:DUF218 domain
MKSNARAFFGRRLALLCLAGLVLTGFLAAGHLLSFPAGVPRHVDAVVVLAGDGVLSATRYARGRDLVLAGYSERLILTYPSDAEFNDTQVRDMNVRIVAFMPASGSWPEAVAVRKRMQAEGLQSVMVVSDPPHMLRLLYTWGSIFRGTGLDYTLVATKPPWWSGWCWWCNPDALGFVGSEVLKLGYYLVRYRFGF